MAQVSGFALGVVERMHRGAELCANGKREHIPWPPMNADERSIWWAGREPAPLRRLIMIYPG
jgi:hypothetical protein